VAARTSEKGERIVTRKVLAAAWNAAVTEANCVGAIRTNHAAFAGFLLAQANGDVRKAIASCPTDSKWFIEVLRMLNAISADEAA